jgi:hypothetical protein
MPAERKLEARMIRQTEFAGIGGAEGPCHAQAVPGPPPTTMIGVEGRASTGRL